jgi:acyl CoA:acetate/3-ketoacid CoA transferase
VGNGKGRGMGVLAKEGLVTSMVYAWLGVCPEFLPLIRDSKIEAWNLPFGCGALCSPRPL